MPVKLAAASALLAGPLFVSSASAQGDFVTIPLRTSGVGHFHLDGKLNDIPLEVLLDTGAGSTIIDKQVADELGLTLTPLAAKGGGAGAASLQIWSVAEARFELGGVTLDDAQILAMDFANMRAALAAKGISPPKMILGADILRSRAAVIDYGANTLSLKLL